MIHKNINEKQNNFRLDQAATMLFEDFSRSQIQKWILQGNLLVNGEHLKAKEKVHIGDELALDPVFEKRVSWDGEDIPLDILYEEEDFLIINKSSGMVMHPGAGCYNGTLANSLAFHFPNLRMNFIHLKRLKGFAIFFKINFLAVPWSGETLKYFNPNVKLIASHSNSVFNGVST